MLLAGIGFVVLCAAESFEDLLPAVESVIYGKNLLATVFFLGLGLHAFWVRGPLWGCLVVVPVLQVLASGTHLSMIRVVLSAFPGFLDAAEIASNRSLFAITVSGCLFAQFVLLGTYVNWEFVA